jgi:hypothetical protein
MADPTQALTAHGQRIDAAVLRFSEDLDRVVAIAQAQLTNALLDRLDLDENQIIKRTLRNVKTLRKLPAIWQQALDDAGLDVVVQRYLNVFPQQIPEFNQILQALNHAAENPLPLPDFTASDHQLFSNLTINAGSDISAVVENAATSAITRTSFSLGTVGLKALVRQIMSSTGASISRASTLADTALMGFYRTIAENAYEKIETKLGRPLLYDYVGPLDLITRRVCREWVLHSLREPFTKAQIDALDNGTGFMPVWTFGGGPNCRHSILASLRFSVH